jgi:hypothetical protein
VHPGTQELIDGCQQAVNGDTIPLMKDLTPLSLELPVLLCPPLPNERPGKLALSPTTIVLTNSIAYLRADQSNLLSTLCRFTIRDMKAVERKGKFEYAIAQCTQLKETKVGI